jgi:hypothetical protein
VCWFCVCCCFLLWLGSISIVLRGDARLCWPLNPACHPRLLLLRRRRRWRRRWRMLLLLRWV